MGIWEKYSKVYIFLTEIIQLFLIVASVGWTDEVYFGMSYSAPDWCCFRYWWDFRVHLLVLVPTLDTYIEYNYFEHFRAALWTDSMHPLEPLDTI